MSAYNEIYLDSTLKIHEYLLHLFISSEYDFFDLLKGYLMSEERRNIDEGNPLSLNLTPRQLMNRIPLYNIGKGDNTKIDPFVTNWIADVLVYLQWDYEMASSEIAEKVDLKRLYRLYNPLHETALSIGTDKVFAIFWGKQ